MNGIKDLSPMITNRKFAIVFIICLVVYIIPEVFFNNAMLYLSGGIIGGSISEFFKNTLGQVNNLYIFFTWALLLGGLVFLFFRLKNNILRYLVLFIIAFFLYIIDNLLGFVPIETKDEKSVLILQFIIIGVSILIKSTFVAWIYLQSEKNSISIAK